MVRFLWNTCPAIVGTLGKTDKTENFIRVMNPFKEEGLKGLGCGIGEALEGFPWELEAGDEWE